MGLCLLNFCLRNLPLINYIVIGFIKGINNYRVVLGECLPWGLNLQKKRSTKIYKIICIKVVNINVLHPLGLNTFSSVGFTLVTTCTTYPKKCLYPGSILLVACMFFLFF